MTAQNGDEKVIPRRVPLWLWGTLVASLALNLLFVGAIAGAFWHGKGAKGGRGGGIMRSVISFAGQLPQDRRSIVGPLIEGARDSVRPMRRKLRQEYRALKALIAADDFEQEKFKGALGTLLESQLALRRTSHEQLTKILALLTAEERKKLMAWHNERRRRGRRPR